MSDTTDFSNVVTEARGEFNLMERLHGRPTRTAKETVYLDEVAGAEHTALLAQLEAAKRDSDDPEDYSGLEARVRELAAAVRRSGLTFHLRATPPVVSKRAEREARKALNIKGNVPAELLEEYGDQYTARIFCDTVENWVDHETGTNHGRLTVEEAIGLKHHLPTGQYDRLDKAIAELDFKAQISDSVTADADF